WIGIPITSNVPVKRPGVEPTSVVTGCSEPTHGMYCQSGTPTTGRRGSPWNAESVRHEETPGYGCEIGPGNHRSSIATGKSDIHGTKRPAYGVPPYSAGASSAAGVFGGFCRRIACTSAITALAS